MIKLRQSEIDRACNGWTVVVRPQSGGGVMVSTVNIEDGRVWADAGTIVKNGEVQSEIRQQLRMLDKLGFDIPMANKSRHRTGRKMSENA